jgi:hypothetical protein
MDEAANAFSRSLRLLKQGQALCIPATESSLIKDMALEIEAAMREQNEEKR